MKISRNIAINILKYLDSNKSFNFPFLVVCKEYTYEDDDFVEIEPDEWREIEEDKIYQTFELREKSKDVDNKTIDMLAKGFVSIIINDLLVSEIKNLFIEYDKLYKPHLTESVEVLDYGENEFFGGKREAFQEVLALIKKYNE